MSNEGRRDPEVTAQRNQAVVRLRHAAARYAGTAHDYETNLSKIRFRILENARREALQYITPQQADDIEEKAMRRAG